MFTDKQTHLLKLNLDGKRVKTRQQGNISLSYLEGYDIIDMANLAFGFGNWGYEVKELTQISEETNANQNLVIGYKALVTVTVFDVHHKHYVMREDVGFGTGIAKDYATAHESAGKEHGELESAPDGVVANPAVAPADAEAGGADRPV
jgi:DNA repair and recombination protein RAD52